MRLRTMLAAGIAAVISVMPASAASWAGYYGGVSLSYIDRTAEYHDIGFWMNGATSEYDEDGVGIGVQVGHNWVEGEFLYGVEANVDFADINYHGFHHGETNIDTGGDWSGSLRGRAGIAAGRTLLYATAGLAIVDAEYHWDEDTGEFFNTSDSYIGWVAGFGIERQMEGNWSLRFEVTRTDIEQETVLMDDGGPDPDYPFDLDTSIDTMRVSANFPFTM